MTQTRIEKDSMGAISVPNWALWGAQTQRSFENFKIGTEQMPKELLKALLLVKKNAAKANEDAKLLSKDKSIAIQKAITQILEEDNWCHFPLVIWQTGSGTQTNMNANEVIANLANKNGTRVHPNDDVNKSQSSNDVFPTSMQIAAYLTIANQLLPALKNMIHTLKELEARYKETIKIGRTHLQDATPITFGQEISGWRFALEQNEQQLLRSLESLKLLPIGGTAVGTGLNATKEYVDAFITHLNHELGVTFHASENKFHGLAFKDSFVFASGALKALAANLLKIANDIRWLASGPRSGLGELTLPSNEPGSSIMPGKVNPTQAEALTMIAVQVMGNDTTIGIAASQGNFELNVYMPVISYNFLQSVTLLTDGLLSFDKNCLRGLKANEEKMRAFVDQSLMLITALNSKIGYDKGAEIAKKAFNEQLSLKEAAISLGHVTSSEYDRWIKPEEMTQMTQEEKK